MMPVGHLCRQSYLHTRSSSLPLKEFWKKLQYTEYTRQHSRYYKTMHN